jgi:DNA-binding protein YbaB
MSERLEEINDKLEALNKALSNANSDNLKKEIEKQIDALALEGIREVKKHLEEWREEVAKREDDILTDGVFGAMERAAKEIEEERQTRLSEIEGEEEGHLDISINKSGEFKIDTNGFSYVEILGLLEVVKQKFINDNN